ncbi:MAG: CHAD domain-containing protein [Myxococcales bacterium]|nr:CHAD domain-containing protein [Myxococcales bacterium]
MARQSSSEVETSAAAPSYTHRIVDIVDRQGFAFVAPAGIDVEALLERLRGEAMVERASRERVDDTYLDSERGDLARAGLRARYRRRSLVNGVTGKATRRIEVEPIVLLPELAFERHLLWKPLARVDAAGAEVADFVLDALAVTCEQPLVPQLAVQGERITYRVAGVGCEARLCVADQRVRLPAGSSGRASAAGDGKRRARRAAHVVEFWLSLERGEVQAFGVLAQHLQTLGELSLNKATTHELAQAALSLPVHKLGAPTPELELDESTDSIARKICLAQLETICAFAEGTRLSLDAEYLHKMRVATRRLRAALRNFAGCFDARAELFLLDELRWLAAVLGEVRDFDVHLIDYSTWRAMLGPEPSHGWHQLRGELVTRREQHKWAMRQALASPRYRKLIARARATFGKAAPRRREAGHVGRQTAAEHAAAHVGKRVKQVRRAARRAVSDASGAGVHELRIRCKKLRYTAEFYAPLYGKKLAKRIKRLSSLQDRLGKFQDCMIAGELVERLRADAARQGGVVDDASDYGFVLGTIGGWARASAHGADVEADDALDDIGGHEYLKDLRRRVAALVQDRDDKREEDDAPAVSAETRNGRSAPARRRRQPQASADQQGTPADRPSGEAARPNGRGADPSAN